MPWTPIKIDHLQGKVATLNIGHRGAAGLAPENTLMAFEAAQKSDAQGVEFDVMLTADKQLVVFHDQVLQKRLKDKKGKVRDLTLKQLNDMLDLSVYYKMRTHAKDVPAIFRQAMIPTLRAVFDYYKKYPKIVLNVEIKNKDASDKGAERKIAALIKSYQFEKRVIISSFNPLAVWRFRGYAPGIPTGLIYANEGVPYYIKKLWLMWLAQPDAVHPDFKMVDEAYMKWAKQRGFAVNVWTVNEPEDMKRMLKLGVNMIITDYPDRLAKVLKEQAATK